MTWSSGTNSRWPLHRALWNLSHTLFLYSESGGVVPALCFEVKNPQNEVSSQNKLSCCFYWVTSKTKMWNHAPKKIWVWICCYGLLSHHQIPTKTHEWVFYWSSCHHGWVFYCLILCPLEVYIAILIENYLIILWTCAPFIFQWILFVQIRQ